MQSRPEVVSGKRMGAAWCLIWAVVFDVGWSVYMNY
jgi:hypothetical protein